MMANKVCKQDYLLISKPKFFSQIQSKQQGQGKVVEVVTSINGIHNVQIPAKMSDEEPARDPSMQNSEYVDSAKPTYRGDPFRLCRPSWVCLSARTKGPFMRHSSHQATGRCLSQCMWHGLVKFISVCPARLSNFLRRVQSHLRGSQALLILLLRK